MLWEYRAPRLQELLNWVLHSDAPQEYPARCQASQAPEEPAKGEHTSRLHTVRPLPDVFQHSIQTRSLYDAPARLSWRQGQCTCRRLHFCPHPGHRHIKSSRAPHCADYVSRYWVWNRHGRKERSHSDPETSGHASLARSQHVPLVSHGTQPGHPQQRHQQILQNMVTNDT